MDALTSQHPREAMLGGRPGVLELVRAYVSVLLRRSMGGAEMKTLEVGMG